MNAVLLMSLALGADSPKPSTKVEGVQDLASISFRQASDLHGRKARYRGDFGKVLQILATASELPSP